MPLLPVRLKKWLEENAHLYLSRKGRVQRYDDDPDDVTTAFFGGFKPPPCLQHNHPAREYLKVKLQQPQLETGWQASQEWSEDEARVDWTFKDGDWNWLGKAIKPESCGRKHSSNLDVFAAAVVTLDAEGWKIPVVCRDKDLRKGGANAYQRCR
ncbi:uncharacterized protein M6G45_002873 isoform 1-T1 [Spheniscus humboldti]